MAHILDRHQQLDSPSAKSGPTRLRAALPDDRSCLDEGLGLGQSLIDVQPGNGLRATPPKKLW